MRLQVKKSTQGLLVWLIIGVIFLFIGLSLHRNWHKIPFHELRFNYAFLLLSFCSHLAGYLTAPLGWSVNLRNFGQRMSYRHSLEILSLSRLGRYLPGKIWFTLGRAYMGRRVGVREKYSVVAVLFEVAIMLLSACVFFLLSVFALARVEIPVNPVWFGAIIAACLLGLVPGVFSRIVNLGLKLLKRSPIDFTPKARNLLLLFGIYLLMWAFQGLGFFLLVNSFFPVRFSAAPGFMGIYAFSWMVGFLSFVTPAGLGVREAAMSLALKHYIPEPVGIIATLLARIWATVVELFLFLVFARKLKRYSR